MTMKSGKLSAKQKYKAGIIGMSMVISVLLIAAVVVMTKLNIQGTQKALNSLTTFRNVSESEAEAQKQALLIKSNYESAGDATARATVLSSYSCNTSGTTITSAASVEYTCHVVSANHPYFNKEVIILSAKKDVPGKAEWGRVMLLLNP
jgi:hypothetical protein